MKSLFKSTYISSALSLLALVFVLGACKKNFDEPPTEDLITLTANKSISEIKALHTIGGTPVKITENWVIEGIVIADDESGNFYKSLVIQDETGGLEIRLDATGLSGNYPIGRRVWIKCQDLYIGDYSGKHQLVMDENNSAIPEMLIPNYIFRGEKDQEQPVQLVTISQLDETYSNTLIRLDSVEFASADAGQTYADAVGSQSLNRTITDCNGNTILLRSSGYADFAPLTTPTGKGSITGVFSVFGTDKQLFIRNTADVDMAGTRCDGTTGGGGGTGGTGDLTDISAIRALFSGTETNAPNAKIRGYVTSDRTTGNWQDQNLTMQDATGGITVRFDAAHSFSRGDEIEIDVNGIEISEFNGLLQLNYIPTNNATVISTGNVLLPQSVSVSDLNANFENYESELITITGATISGGTTYSGNLTVNDGNGTVTLYTSFNATFASASVPSGSVDITAVVSEFNGSQLLLRDENDVTGGATINYDFEETFSTTTISNPSVPIDAAGWQVYNEAGTESWEGREFSNNQYAQVSAFGTSLNSMITWLVSPVLDLNANKFLSFDAATAFHAHDGLTVWISTDYDGNTANIASSTWTQLTPSLPGASNSNYEWVNSGNLDLSSYTGNNAYIAFKYDGDDTGGNTTTYQLDNVRLWDQ